MSSAKTKFGQFGGKPVNYDKTDIHTSISNANIMNTGRDFGVTKSNNSKEMSLKLKLNDLEENIQEISKKMNQLKKETTSLKIEKDTLQELITIKNGEIRRLIAQEISRVDEEMKRYFAHQKAENSRLSNQLVQFKNDKNIFNQFLAEMFKKIRDLELQIGTI
jgi:chromosome segregation ATPase